MFIENVLELNDGLFMFFFFFLIIPSLCKIF